MEEKRENKTSERDNIAKNIANTVEGELISEFSIFNLPIFLVFARKALLEQNKRLLKFQEANYQWQKSVCCEIF